MTGRAVAEKVVDPTPLGSILRDGCLQTKTEEYSLPQTATMEVALGLDLINEILYGLWYNGGLNLAVQGKDLGALASGIDLTGATIALGPLLPPILSDCNNKGILQLQLGDSWVDAHIPIGDLLIDFKGWMSLEIGAVLTVVDGKLALTISGIETFDLTIIEAGGAFADDPVALEDTIKILLNTQLQQLHGDALGAIEARRASHDAEGAIAGLRAAVTAPAAPVAP